MTLDTHDQDVREDSGVRRLEAAAERIFARAMATDAVQSTEMLDSDGEWVRAHYADGGSDPTVIWSDW